MAHVTWNVSPRRAQTLIRGTQSRCWSWSERVSVAGRISGMAVSSECVPRRRGYPLRVDLRQVAAREGVSSHGVPVGVGGHRDSLVDVAAVAQPFPRSHRAVIEQVGLRSAEESRDGDGMAAGGQGFEDLVEAANLLARAILVITLELHHGKKPAVAIGHGPQSAASRFCRTGDERIPNPAATCLLVNTLTATGAATSVPATRTASLSSGKSCPSRILASSSVSEAAQGRPVGSSFNAAANWPVVISIRSWRSWSSSDFGCMTLITLNDF